MYGYSMDTGNPSVKIATFEEFDTVLVSKFRD